MGHDVLRIGDTLAEDRTVVFDEIPAVHAGGEESFAYLNNPVPANSKKFRLGLEQLMQEGVVQMLYVGTGQVKTPLLAAVGPLQFEVVQYRRQAEYQAESHLESARWTRIRWWRKDGEGGRGGKGMAAGDRDGLGPHAVDRDERPLVLFADEWALRNFTQRNPGLASEQRRCFCARGDVVASACRPMCEIGSAARLLG